MSCLETRKFDELGRIVIPLRVRKKLGAENDGEIAFCEDESGRIFLKRSTSSCALCGSDKGLSAINGKHICKACAEKLSSISH